MKSVTQLIVASRDTRKPECRTRDVAKMSHTRCQRRCRAQGKEECDTLIQKVVTLKFKVRQHFGSECDDTKILQKKLQLGHTSSIADDKSSLKICILSVQKFNKNDPVYKNGDVARKKSTVFSPN